MNNKPKISIIVIVHFDSIDQIDDQNPIVFTNDQLESAFNEFQPIENNTICLQSESCISDWLKKFDYLYGKLAQRLTLLNVIIINLKLFGKK